VDFECDEQKSAWTLGRRGFDFDFASRIFDGPVLERVDERREYGESRIQAIGSIEGIFSLSFTPTVLADDGSSRLGGRGNRNVSYGCRSQVARADTRRQAAL
jgi:uncharacterized DUF497 family protein